MNDSVGAGIAITSSADNKENDEPMMLPDNEETSYFDPEFQEVSIFLYIIIL